MPIIEKTGALLKITDCQNGSLFHIFVLELSGRLSKKENG